MGDLLSQSKIVFLGLGSNKGNRRQNLLRALFELRELVSIQNISSVYASDALLPEGAPESWSLPFLNFVVMAETKLEPLVLLDGIKKIEKKLGRENTKRWSPREIDIDILLYHGVKISSEKINLPHKEIFSRPFVLLPLLELHPNFTKPSSDWQYKTPFNTKKISWRIDMPQLMGIINITPDSFSGDGILEKHEIIEQRISALVHADCDLIDLGGESTRPGAQTITQKEEMQRVHFAIKVALDLIKKTKSETRLSIDTRNPETAEYAIENGVHIINDVSGLQNPKMISLAQNADCDFVFMHNLGLPADPQKTISESQDPLDFVLKWGMEQVRTLVKAGIPKERLIFDPGVGFGKTAIQSLRILGGASKFKDLGVRTLIGHSRKSFLKVFSAKEGRDRDLETLICSQSLVTKGIDFLRVHDVIGHRNAFEILSVQNMLGRAFYDEL